MTKQNHHNPHEVNYDDANTSNNPEFSDIIETRISRRTVLQGAAGVTVASFLGMSLTGCNGSNDSSSGGAKSERPSQLKFDAVSHKLDDVVTVPDGYKVDVILPVGTPINKGVAEWKENGQQSGESFKMRMGDNHDGMWFFGKNGNKYDPAASDNGIICINHEYCERQYLSPNGYKLIPQEGKSKPYDNKRDAEDIRREVNAHGVAVVELKKKAAGGYDMVIDSGFNRRITSMSDIDIKGPAAKSDDLKTKFSKDGSMTRGINNQCGAGLSPWGTFITVEENFRGAFGRGNDASKRTEKDNIALSRYGVDEAYVYKNYWFNPEVGADQDEFMRWDITVSGASATEDYRNALNTFGYIVEIDPFNPTSKAVKRTALGRFAHENCSYAPVEEGKPVVFYMGDDSRGEYIYKFVSEATWSNSDIGGGLAAGDKYMDKGTLYVAVFNEDGTGEWKELAFGKNGITADNANFAFAGQSDVYVYSRLAADAAGATKMDRPEWVSVNPETKEVYVTLTNNRSTVRPEKYPVNAANPRNYDGNADGKVDSKKDGNPNGHIIRWKEKNDDHAATSFTWDIYLFGAPHDNKDANKFALTKNNDFSSPDGLFFDARGVLWIQTDDGAYTDTSNCMLLAALPGKVSDGGEATVDGTKTFLGAKATEETVKRFLTGPKDCEITGITMTPDMKTLFVNVQHPGEDGDRTKPTSHWPTTQTEAGNTTAIPRSATVVITKEDGGVILGESL